MRTLFFLLYFAPAAVLAAQPKALLPDRAFPSAKELFHPLLADPMELGYGGRYVLPVGGDRFGEVMIGDYVGIFRWRDAAPFKLQLNFGGGALSRFNLSTPRNNMEVVDFTGALPVDARWGKEHAVRTGLWHISSHLGDDYIGRERPLLKKRAMDYARVIYGWMPGDFMRLYAGGAWAFNTINIERRGALQFGAEFLTKPIIKDAGQFFFAHDFQAYERMGWNPSFNMRAGLRFTEDKKIAAANIFIEYFTGRQYFLQFYERHESRWTLGVNFEIGTPVR